MSGNNLRSYNLCLLGYGNVNRALVRLLHERRQDLRDRYGIAWRVTGIASRRLGWIASPSGLDTTLLTESGVPRWNLMPHLSPPPGDVREWLRAARADVLFEATSLNARTGQPAIDHVRAALEAGAHAITANKGTVVHAYEELRDLAASRGRQFLFESTVMDGVPIFCTYLNYMPLLQLKGFHGILNSTTNLVLTGMEHGLSLREALKKAQDMGIAETEASDDLEGWDAAVKVAALVRVLMGVALPLDEIQRVGITALTSDAVRDARAEGRPYKLLCRATRAEGGVRASVGPEQVPLSSPLAHVSGASSAVYFETDMFPGLAITENNPSLDTTAYGMLADFVRAAARQS